MASPKTDSVSILLDASPLIDLLAERNLLQMVQHRTLKRWRTVGIDIYWADKWSVRLGYHPIELFGMDFYQLAEMGTDDNGDARTTKG